MKKHFKEYVFLQNLRGFVDQFFQTRFLHSTIHYSNLSLRPRLQFFFNRTQARAEFTLFLLKLGDFFAEILIISLCGSRFIRFLRERLQMS